MGRDVGIQCSDVTDGARRRGESIVLSDTSEMRKQQRNGLTAFLLSVLFIVGCGGPPEFVFTLPTSDGVVSFVATTSDPDVLTAAREELDRPESDRSLYILGPLAEGDGGHNGGWGWHFVPGGWELTDTSMDLCDADPQFVEDALQDWIQKIGRYCPKGARLTAER